MNVGGPEALILLLILALGVVPLVLGIVVAVDASRLPDDAFSRARTNKTLWIILPIVGIFVCGVVPIGAAIAWFASYKPRILNATEQGAPGALGG